jgi:hypothetical protein
LSSLVSPMLDFLSSSFLWILFFFLTKSLIFH